MANLEKHVKSQPGRLAVAGAGLVPAGAADLHPVERSVQDPRLDPERAPAAAVQPPPVVLRLEALPATPACLARIRRRVDEINRQFHQSDVPVRLRIM